ncbi:DNA polymerase III subunit tau [compost metagenome]
MVTVSFLFLFRGLTRMSDLAYHRKFRSKTLTEYIGNEKMKNSLMASLRGSANRPQVLLYKGTAGCGKTTMARLTAKEYLCENRDDIFGACGECRNCKEIEIFIETGEAGHLYNVQEVDVTDSNKKQDIDELLEDAATPSMDGNWKIFILDECHEMSKAAQNRLLKNLEEPAPRVLMILCTTDPEKLLATIRSRCQGTFTVTKPSRNDLVSLLARVCKAEGVEYDARGLSVVCTKGNFVPRDTLIALENVVREKQNATYDSVIQALNTVADAYFFNFYDILLTTPVNTLKFIKLISEIKLNADLHHFISELLTFTIRGIYVYSGESLEGLDKSEIDLYTKLFQRFSVDNLVHILNTLLSIKSSQDLELKLLILGYTGLTPSNSDAKRSEVAQLTPVSVAAEKRLSDASHMESLVMSDKEKEQFVEGHSKVLTEAEVLQRFQGAVKFQPKG